MEQEKIKRDVAAVLQAFAQAENGNKISQFNMGGLAQMIMGVIDGTVVVQQGQQQPGQMQDFPTAQVGEDMLTKVPEEKEEKPE